MAHTVTLDGQSFPVTDIKNIHFGLSDGKVTLDIETKIGDFHYDCLLAETDKLNSLRALQLDLVSSLIAISHGLLKVE